MRDDLISTLTPRMRSDLITYLVRMRDDLITDLMRMRDEINILHASAVSYLVFSYACAVDLVFDVACVTHVQRNVYTAAVRNNGIHEMQLCRL